MREKTRVPNELPDLRKVRMVYEEWFKTPSLVLNGKTPADLFREHGVEDCWIVGSCAWMPVVLGKPHDGASDIDIVFLYKEATEDFVKHVLDLLNTSKSDPEVRYIVEESLHGGTNIVKAWVAGNHRLMRETAVGVWSLGEHSIAEHIKEYPLDHQRCAIEVATSSVTRLVKQDYQSYRKAEEYRRGQYGGGS
jgi:hypothetical protein